jgi:hypothetical protein
MAEAFKLEVVPEETDPPSRDVTAGRPAADAGMAMLMMGLKALSQRALIALSACFTLITVGSCFWLYMSRATLDPQELILCGMYALFVLAANVIVRRA